jgi:hypothetical protein
LTIINVLKHGINIFCRGDTHEENGFAERYLSRQSGGGKFPDADAQPSNKIQQAWPPLPTRARTESIRLRHGLQKARAIVADGIVLACSLLLPDKRLQGGRLLSRPLKNYLRWQYGVKNRLGCEPSRNAHLQLVNSRASPVRFLACFCLVLPASLTFFNGLLVLRRSDSWARPTRQSG